MLTRSDIAVLQRLQSGADETRAELAEGAGMSPSTVWRRINELEAAGVIVRRVALLDPVKAGFPVCMFVFVNLNEYSAPTRRKFESFVDATPEILECYSVTGAHDYTLLVRCRTVNDFEDLLMNRILSHASVRSATSQLALRQNKYSTELPLELLLDGTE